MRQSELFTRGRREAPADEVAKNAKLLVRAGFVHKEMAGVYSFLPLGWLVLKKLEKLVRTEMLALGAQEILMSALQPKDNWQATGRWEKMTDLYKLRDRNERELALGPTHEEIVTPLVKNYLDSYQDLPLAVFQFQTKFRMEPRAKSGLLRGREFLMKDLYSFHRDEADLRRFYDLVSTAYKKILMQLGLAEKTYFTLAGGGTFAEFSHEFQILTPAGEDSIRFCDRCRLAVNEEIFDRQNNCPGCGTEKLPIATAIEIANIFKLGANFSRAFNLTYRDQAGVNQPVLMGCYGLGISRLLGALAEVLSDEKGLVWPEPAAPFLIHLLSVGPAAGSAGRAAERLYERLIKLGREIFWDDREISAGEKFAAADLLGLPYQVVISEKTLAAGKIELIKRATGEKSFLTEDELCVWPG